MVKSNDSSMEECAMNRVCAGIFITAMLLGINTNTVAAEDRQHSGVDTSAEHKSESGLEHGEAYAGSKEKEDKEDKEDKEKKEKKEKKDK